MEIKRILVAWFRFTVNGGINRFILIARVLKPLGYEVEFVSLNNKVKTKWPDFPGKIMTFEEASEKSWDVVMVPGEGCEKEDCHYFERLQDPRFGLRVQHILSDLNQYEKVKQVNFSFNPDMVISNNSHWEEKDFADLKGKAFHILPGAVNTDIFYPGQNEQNENKKDLWVIGGIAPKNLEPLLDAIDILPGKYQLHLFGKAPGYLRWRLWKLICKRKVVSHGPIFGKDLADFYKNIDVMVTTEKEAGWCNAAAEASVTGVPCIVTRHGTIDFIKHMENGMVLDEISGTAIAENIIKLTSDQNLRQQLAKNAITSMKKFSHTSYCDRMISLLKDHIKN
jgi:glycosyltransferase involved in cell wall biosynthesis